MALSEVVQAQIPQDAMEPGIEVGPGVEAPHGSVGPRKGLLREIHRAVAAYAKDAEYDLVAGIGYLGSLDPAIDAVDVTEDVIEVLTEDS